MQLFQKIKNRMLILIIGFAIIIISTMAFLSIAISTKSIESEIHAKVSLMAERTALNVEKEFDHVEERVDDLGHLIGEKYKGVKDFDFENTENAKENSLLLERFLDEIREDIRYTSQRLEIGESIYFFVNPKLSVKKEDVFHAIFLVQSGDRRFNPWSFIPNVNELDSEKKEFSWFYEPILNGKGSWTDFYYNKYIGEDVFSYASPVYVDNKFIGVVGLDIARRDVEEIVSGYNIKDSSYAILINENLDFLIHPQYKNMENLSRVNNGELGHLSNIMNNQSDGVIEHQVQGEDIIVGYCRLDNGWYLAIVPNLDDVYVNINKLLKYLLITAAFAVFVFIIVAESLGDYIGKPVGVVNKTLKKLSENNISDHTEIYSLFSYNDEIGVIAKSLSDLIIEQQELIKNIFKSSEIFMEKGMETNENISNLGKINRSQNYSINNLKDAIMKLVTLAEKVYAEILSLSTKHNDFKENSSNMLEVFDENYRKLERDHSLIESFSNHAEVIVNNLEKMRPDVENQHLYDSISTLLSDVGEISKIYRTSYDEFADTAGVINKLIYNTHEILKMDENLFESIGDITSNLNEALMQADNIDLNNRLEHKTISIVKEEVNIILEKSNKLKVIAEKYK